MSKFTPSPTRATTSLGGYCNYYFKEVESMKSFSRRTGWNYTELSQIRRGKNITIARFLKLISFMGGAVFISHPSLNVYLSINNGA